MLHEKVLDLKVDLEVVGNFLEPLKPREDVEGQHPPLEVDHRSPNRRRPRVLYEGQIREVDPSKQRWGVSANKRREEGKTSKEKRKERGREEGGGK